MFAKLLDDNFTNVAVEPSLIPLTGEVLSKSANVSDEARLDISARGFWQKYEMAFFDVRVFNPFAKSYQNQTLRAAFVANEKEKKRSYNQRIIQIEQGSFTPLVFCAYGGCGRENDHFISHLVNHIAQKRDLPTSTIMNYVRTKISFALTRSLVNCVRGTRSRFRQRQAVVNTNDILISDELSNMRV